MTDYLWSVDNWFLYINLSGTNVNESTTKTLLKNCLIFMHCNYIWSQQWIRLEQAHHFLLNTKHKCTIFPFFNIKQGWVKTDGKKNKIYKSLMLLFTHTHTKKMRGSKKKKCHVTSKKCSISSFLVMSTLNCLLMLYYLKKCKISFVEESQSHCSQLRIIIIILQSQSRKGKEYLSRVKMSHIDTFLLSH